MPTNKDVLSVRTQTRIDPEGALAWVYALTRSHFMKRVMQAAASAWVNMRAVQLIVNEHRSYAFVCKRRCDRSVTRVDCSKREVFWRVLRRVTNERWAARATRKSSLTYVEQQKQKRKRRHKILFCLQIDSIWLCARQIEEEKAFKLCFSNFKIDALFCFIRGFLVDFDYMPDTRWWVDSSRSFGLLEGCERHHLGGSILCRATRPTLIS